MEHFNWLTGFWFPYVNFAIFVAVLVFMGRKPIQTMLSKRKREFEEAYHAAEKAQERAEKKLQELNARLAGLDEEIALLKSQAKADAEAEAARIIARGEAMAAHFESEARRLIVGEQQRAKAQLEAEVLAEVRKQVSTRLQNELSAEQQSSYFHKQLQALNEIAGQPS